jgi:hypothetical protein
MGVPKDMDPPNHNLLVVVVLPDIGDDIAYSSLEFERRFNLIHEKEWTGETVSIVCKRYGVQKVLL